MKPNIELFKRKGLNTTGSKSATNSQNSLNSSKFHFEKPLNIIWRTKRTSSTEHKLDLTETCMFNEENIEKNSKSISVESQTDPAYNNILILENYELVSEIQRLRSEVKELKSAVKELQVYKKNVEFSEYKKILGLENELEAEKKYQRPPLPFHRPAKSHNF